MKNLKNIFFKNLSLLFLDDQQFSYMQKKCHFVKKKTPMITATESRL